MSFEKEFQGWLKRELKSELPKEIKAFSFNLLNPAGFDGVKFGVELVGASRFDESDPDWACDEIWEPEQRYLNIPIQYSGESWEVCLEQMKCLIADTLNSNQSFVSKLKSSMGVAVGFVDGDLEIVWQP